MKKAKKESCLGSIERRTADIVRREVTAIAQKKKNRKRIHQHIIDNGIIPIPKCPTASLPITRRYSGGHQAVNPKRQLEQIKPTRVDCIPRRNLSRGQKRRVPPKRKMHLCPRPVYPLRPKYPQNQKERKKNRGQL